MKAEARNRAAGTPITEAATSLSRSAPSARPGRPRRRFLAATAASATSTRPKNQSRSSPPKGTPSTARPSSASPRLSPRIAMSGTVRPLKPPVYDSALSIAWWPKKTRAKVATPRYMPRSRPDRGLKAAPAAPASPTAATKASKGEGRCPRAPSSRTCGSRRRATCSRRPPPPGRTHGRGRAARPFPREGSSRSRRSPRPSRRARSGARTRRGRGAVPGAADSRPGRRSAGGRRHTVAARQTCGPLRRGQTRVDSLAPSRPCGRTTRTSTITAYGTTSASPEPSPLNCCWYPVASASAMPTSRLPRSAPPTDPSPPSTAAGKAARAI